MADDQGRGLCSIKDKGWGLAMDNGKLHCQFLEVTKRVTKQGRETAETSLLKHKSHVSALADYGISTILDLKASEGLPGSPGVRLGTFTAGAGAQSLVGRLRPYKVHSTAKNKKVNKYIQGNEKRGKI